MTSEAGTTELCIDCPNLPGWKQKIVKTTVGLHMKYSTVYLGPNEEEAHSKAELLQYLENSVDLTHFDFMTGAFVSDGNNQNADQNIEEESETGNVSSLEQPGCNGGAADVDGEEALGLGKQEVSPNLKMEKPAGILSLKRKADSEYVDCLALPGWKRRMAQFRNKSAVYYKGPNGEKVRSKKQLAMHVRGMDLKPFNYVLGTFPAGSNNEDPKLKKKEKKPETETARVLSESDRSDSHEVGHRKERRETRLKKNDNNICAEEGSPILKPQISAAILSRKRKADSEYVDCPALPGWKRRMVQFTNKSAVYYKGPNGELVRSKKQLAMHIRGMDLKPFNYILGTFPANNNKADDPKLVKDSETETAGPLSEYDCSYDHEVGDRRKRGEAPLKKTDNDVSLQEAAGHPRPDSEVSPVFGEFVDCPALPGFQMKIIPRKSTPDKADTYYRGPDGRTVRSKKALAGMVGDRADLKHFNFKLGVFTTGGEVGEKAKEEEMIEELNPMKSPDCTEYMDCPGLPGWEMKVVPRQTTAPAYNICYRGPQGQKAKTKAQLAKCLGNSVDLTNFKLWQGQFSTAGGSDDAHSLLEKPQLNVYVDCPALPGWKRRITPKKITKCDICYKGPNGEVARTKHKLASILGDSVDLTNFLFKEGTFAAGSTDLPNENPPVNSIFPVGFFRGEDLRRRQSMEEYTTTTTMDEYANTADVETNTTSNSTIHMEEGSGSLLSMIKQMADKQILSMRNDLVMAAQNGMCDSTEILAEKNPTEEKEMCHNETAVSMDTCQSDDDTSHQDS